MEWNHGYLLQRCGVLRSTVGQLSVDQIALNNCTLAVSANNDWFGIYVRGRGMSSFGMEVNAKGKNVQFVKDGEPFKSL